MTLKEAAGEGEGVRQAARVTEVPALGEAATVRVSEDSNEGVGKALREGKGEANGEGVWLPVALGEGDCEAQALPLGEALA